MNATTAADDLLADGCVSVGGAVREFGFGRTRLYELMGSGDLPFTRNGVKRLIPRKALRKLLADGLVGAGPAAAAK